MATTRTGHARQRIAERAECDACPVQARLPIHDTAIVEEPWFGRIATADGLFVTDERQRVVTWSSSAQRILGFSPEEVVNRPCYLALMGREPDGHPVCRRSCPVTTNARRGRGTAAYEVMARARDGSAKLLSFSVLVLEQPGGGFHVLHLFREVRGAPVGERLSRVGRVAHRSGRAPVVETLTRRELEVLRMVAQGSTIDEVAEALAISVFTARNHVANVQGKLGARNRLEMVLLGMRSGLV